MTTTEVPKLILSCASLQPSERIELLAQFLRKHRLDRPEVAMRFRPVTPPGVCQICGHPLAVAYRAVHLTSLKSYEIAPDSPDIEEIERWLHERAGRREEMKAALSEDVTFYPVHACPEISSESLWDEARKLNASRLR